MDPVAAAFARIDENQNGLLELEEALSALEDLGISGGSGAKDEKAFVKEMKE